MMKWIKDRMCEPTSYLAVGVAVMAIGIIFGESLLIWAGLIGGGLGFVLKERGVM